MGNLLSLLPQSAIKYSYMHSPVTDPDYAVHTIRDATNALGPEALAIPSGNAFYDTLTIISGLFWTLVYIILIYKGFKDKTCGMPIFVLGLNWAWEFLFGFCGEPFMSTTDTVLGISTAHGTPQRVWDCIWFIFDCILIYLKVKYGRKEMKGAMPHIPDKLYIPYIAVVCIWGWVFVFFSVYEWHDPNGFYAAYMQNFFISLLFIEKLFREGKVVGEGVNLWLAILKFFGTLAPSLLGALTLVNYYKLGLGWPWLSPNADGALNLTWMPFTKMLILNVTLMDIFYIVMVYKTMKREGYSPWAFFNDKKIDEGKGDEFATEHLFDK